MNTPIAIVAGAAMIAAAILVTNHWQIAGGQAQVFRLNLWTGTVTPCGVSDRAGEQLPCEAK